MRNIHTFVQNIIIVTQVWAQLDHGPREIQPTTKLHWQVWHLGPCSSLIESTLYKITSNTTSSRVGARQSSEGSRCFECLTEFNELLQCATNTSQQECIQFDIRIVDIGSGIAAGERSKVRGCFKPHLRFLYILDRFLDLFKKVVPKNCSWYIVCQFLARSIFYP